MPSLIKYPRLNHRLLFFSSLETRSTIASQLLNYALRNLSIMGSRWTRNAIMHLARAVLNPEKYYELLLSDAFRLKYSYSNELLFSNRSGIIRHLKLISERTGEASNDDCLLRQIYIARAPSST